MARRTILGGVLVLMLAVGSAAFAHVGVGVDIGINLGAAPELVPVPSSPVAYAPGVPANYFFYGGRYYVYANGGWYVASAYNGPWLVVEPEFVPRPILAVPVRFYRGPPSAWEHWRREAPPRWESHWGSRWEEHREARHAGHRWERR